MHDEHDEQTIGDESTELVMMMMMQKRSDSGFSTARRPIGLVAYRCVEVVRLLPEIRSASAEPFDALSLEAILSVAL